MGRDILKDFKEWVEYQYGDSAYIEATNDSEVYAEYYREFINSGGRMS